ncbi:hypothetical protein QP794_24780 [Paenibacillus sp. UMB7766-LJ446]|uniref:hypothetical protein n=1 Tax=Paenibacillus sp. UMB7766-LJ446 TaxID=3046313 RepID=UPI00255175E2|nr:hypothetical protein [Paenibacillus sp. UMB7766-LJ446]MDK8193308.1 hypothetical protein [Paenibacillus sp. UMB7766-LJ446]
MKIHLVNGLPIVSLPLSYKNKSTLLNNILLDTGCSTTIFEMLSADCLGSSIDSIVLKDFTIQLGLTKEPYGFDAILGVDFLYKYGLKIDFEKLVIS